MKKFTFLLFLFFVSVISYSQVRPRPVEKDDPHARVQYELNMLRSPLTGQIPENIRNLELQYVTSSKSGLRDLTKSSSVTWKMRGPWNVGGRTRALAVDVTNSSRIVAAGVSGGVWISTDGGQSWTRANMGSVPHSLAITCIAQDTRQGHTNVWYAGTGEYSGNSASGDGGAYYRGNGIFRSTDGGLTWTRVYGGADVARFDDNTDYIWDIAVSPTTGSVFVAAYGSIYKSTDGVNYSVALDSKTSTNSSYATDVAVAPDGTVFATLSSDGDNSGFFYSTDDGQTWNNIPPFVNDYLRTVIGISGSINGDYMVYFLGLRNAQDANGNDLHFLWAINTKTGYIYDRSDNIPMLGGKTGDFDSQGGYDLVVKVKPDDSSTVFIGGTNLFRSTDGFKTTNNTSWVGGYTPKNDSYAKYTNHHPDQHSLFFDPNNPLVLYSGHDGGISKTTNCLDNTANADQETIDWVSLDNGYITTQAYDVDMDATGISPDLIIAGFQDNGTWITTTSNLQDDWIENGSGDGAYCAIAQYNDGRTIIYYSSQNGHVYGDFYDANGNYQGWTRIYPDLSDPLFVNPYALDPNNYDIMYMLDGDSVWVHTSLSSLANNLYSNDAPAGWSVITQATLNSGYYTALAVSHSPSDILFLGTNDGRIFKVTGASTSNPSVSEITGTNFPSGAYVSSITTDPDDANKILVAFSNYQVPSVFYTTNGGQSWTDVSGNLEENPDGSGNGPSVRSVAILKYNGQTVYFAGTSTGLYSTTDLTASPVQWTQEGVGTIGNVVVDMVKTRNSDGMVVIGTHGNGVFSAQYGAAATVVPVENPDMLKVYPNPSDGVFNVIYHGSEDARVLVANITGQIVYSGLNKGVQRVDIRHLPSGVYFVRVIDGQQQFVRKVVIR